MSCEQWKRSGIYLYTVSFSTDLGSSQIFLPSCWTVPNNTLQFFQLQFGQKPLVDSNWTIFTMLQMPSQKQVGHENHRAELQPYSTWIMEQWNRPPGMKRQGTTEGSWRQTKFAAFEPTKTAKTYLDLLDMYKCLRFGRVFWVKRDKFYTQFWRIQVSECFLVNKERHYVNCEFVQRSFADLIANQLENKHGTVESAIHWIYWSWLDQQGITIRGDIRCNRGQYNPLSELMSFQKKTTIKHHPIDFGI